MAGLRCLLLAFLVALAFAPVSVFAKEVPLWEGITKSRTMLAADEEFVATVKKETGGDLQAGAHHAVRRGWEAFERKDYEVAIRRFNQAWLLEDGNPDIYWGFALTTYLRGDGLRVAERWFGEAEQRMARGLALAALFSDHGRVLDESGEPARAKTYFEKALAINPDHLEAHVGMARVLMQSGDRAGADKHLKEIERLKTQ